MSITTQPPSARTRPLPVATVRRAATGPCAALIALVVALAASVAMVAAPLTAAAASRVISGTVTLPVGVDGADVEVRAAVRAFDPETKAPVWDDVVEAPLMRSGSLWTYRLPVAAGTYVVSAVNLGPLAAPTWYPSAPSAEEATPVVVGGSDVALGVLALQRFSSIGGIVTLTSEAPSRTVTVHAHRRSHDGSWVEEADARIDEDGAYRILDLRAGTYRLELTYAGVSQTGGWYAGTGRVPAASRDAAADVVLRAAADLDNVDMRVGRGAVVTGTVRTPAGKAVTSKDLEISAYEEWTDPWGELRWRSVVTATPSRTGTYTISGLPTGTYRFGVEDRSGRNFAVFHPGVADVDRARSVAVTGGTTLRNINFTIDSGTTVKGTVKVPSGIAATGVRVDLLQKVGSTWTPRTTTWVDADGTYAAAGVPAGAYRISIAHDTGALTPWFYARSGPVSTLGAASTLTLGSARTVTVDAILSRRGTPPPAVRVLKRPTVSGTAKVGRTLTAKKGRYSPSGTAVTYRWFVKKGGKAVAIKGATKASLKVKKSFAGRQVRLQVTVTRAAYRSVAVTTKWSRKVTS